MGALFVRVNGYLVQKTPKTTHLTPQNHPPSPQNHPPSPQNHPPSPQNHLPSPQNHPPNPQKLPTQPPKTRTKVRVEDFLNDELEELLGDTPLIHSLFPFKLHVQLLLQLLWVVHRHLQLGVGGGGGWWGFWWVVGVLVGGESFGGW